MSQSETASAGDSPRWKVERRPAWRDFLAVARGGGGPRAFAAALHQRTGMPVSISDPHRRIVAAAGFPAGRSARSGPAPPVQVLAGALDGEGDPGSECTARAGGGRWSCTAGERGRTLQVTLHPDGRNPDGEDLEALETAAAMLSLHLLIEARLAERELRFWGDFVGELLDHPDDGRIEGYAERLGIDLSTPHRAVLFDSPETPADHLLAIVRRAVRRLCTHAEPLVTRRDARVLAAVGEGADLHPSIEEVREAARRSVRVGIGEPLPLGELRRSLADAETALHCQARSGAETTCIDDLGVWRILARSDVAELDDFVERYLGALERYDREHRTALVVTLVEYFACERSLDATAARLYVHRNTLQYRLKRIQAISGLDLGNRGDRLNLELACEALSLRTAGAAVG